MLALFTRQIYSEDRGRHFNDGEDCQQTSTVRPGQALLPELTQKKMMRSHLMNFFPLNFKTIGKLSFESKYLY